MAVPLRVERAVSPGRGELSCSRGYDMPARQRSDAVPSRRGFGEAVEVAGVLLGACLWRTFLMLRRPTMLLPRDRFINNYHRHRALSQTPRTRLYRCSRWRLFQVSVRIGRVAYSIAQLTPALAVIVKHQGKKHEVEVDPSSNGETFKYQLFSITGVEPERQKILVKGGQLKDDADMSKLGLKSGQTIMMMGTPSGDNTSVIEKPKEKIKFLEDMDEAEAAQLEGATPAGLQNLGNTCYMNSTLQVLRSVPELQDELLRYSEG